MKYGIRLKQGRYQVYGVEYDRKGVSTITPMSEWAAIPENIKTGTIQQIKDWQAKILTERGLN